MVDKEDDNIGLRGDRLMRLREQHGWTQMTAGYACKVHPGNLSKMEKGELKNVTSRTLVRLARGYSTSVSYLINDTNDPSPLRESVLDRLTDDEARMLLIYQELLPSARQAVLELAQSISDIQRISADGLPGVPLPAKRPK